jgi:hypothetical protein
MSIDLLPALRPDRVAWNKGRIIGQKRPLLPRHVWSIRVRLEKAWTCPAFVESVRCILRQRFRPAGGIARVRRIRN